jgi:hypothetical protein
MGSDGIRDWPEFRQFAMGFDLPQITLATP